MEVPINSSLTMYKKCHHVEGKNSGDADKGFQSIMQWDTTNVHGSFLSWIFEDMLSLRPCTSYTLLWGALI